MKITDRIFSVSTPELAIAAAAFLQSQEVRLDYNLRIESQVESGAFSGFFSGDPLRIKIKHQNAEWMGDGITKDHFTDLSSLIKYLQTKPLQFPRVGEYDVTHDASGIKVGCTHVPWETLDEIVRVAAIARKTIEQA